MKYTGNYDLKKPEGTDVVNIEDLNDNADIIDQTLKAHNDALDAHKAEKATQEQLGHVKAGQNITIDADGTINAKGGDVNSVNGKTGDVVIDVPDIAGLKSSRLALGHSASAEGEDSIALGHSASAEKNYTIALGWNASAGEYSAVAIGRDASAEKNYTIAIGWNASATDWNSIALGRGASAGYMATALGQNASATSMGAIALGRDASATLSDAIAIGQSTLAEGEDAIAIGENASATGADAIALGRDTSAEGNYSIALGYSASVTKEGGIAIGRNASAGNSGVTLGWDTSAGYTSIALGRGASAGYMATALGSFSSATGNESIALGKGASAEGNYATALGRGASAENSREGILGGTGTSKTSNWKVPGDFTVSGTKNFEIPHPKPEKKATHVIRHGAVESPTPGDTLYRWKVQATKDNDLVTIDLPDYFVWLNKDVQIFVTPQGHFGNGYGELNREKEQLEIHCQYEGEYNVLVIGTRNDDHESVQNWSIKGVEREMGESWTGETYAFSIDEIMEVEEIKEVS